MRCLQLKMARPRPPTETCAISVRRLATSTDTGVLTTAPFDKNVTTWGQVPMYVLKTVLSKLEPGSFSIANLNAITRRGARLQNTQLLLR